jgi:hypothetical protein
MTRNDRSGREPESSQLHPWYRYPWPWVAIAIPAIAVIGGLFTLYLAIINPDPIVVDDEQYREIRSELQAQPVGDQAPPAATAAREDSDGDH